MNQDDKSVIPSTIRKIKNLISFKIIHFLRIIFNFRMNWKQNS